MTPITRVGLAMLLALGLSAVIVVGIVVLLDLTLWVGLVVLALLDAVVLVGGYVLMRRAGGRPWLS